jgi:nitrous oxidase accessory protein NosD
MNGITVPLLGLAYTASLLATPPDPPVLIPAGQSIQQAVDAHPPGTSFVIAAGVHRRQVVRPKDGMSFIGQPGAVLDGEDVAPQAFDAYKTKNVVVRGLRITRYRPPNLNAAIEGADSAGWVVEDNEIDHNSNGALRAYGIRIGTGWIVRGNRIHHNGWVGIEGYNEVGTLIERNDVFANPPSRFDDTVGEAANIKLYRCGRITIRDNYVHDGPFFGIWLDRSQPDMTVDGNRVINHGEAGVWYEASYDGIIRHNYIEKAGTHSSYSPDWLRGGGIQVTNSPNVSVIGNTVVDSLNGIIGLQAESYEAGPFGKSELRNLLVQGNVIVMPRGQSGVAENIGSDAVFTSWNNRFAGNRFELQANRRPFRWLGADLDEHGWETALRGGDRYIR